ncbi:nucleotidyltransferase family protein [Trichothermofontia sp.]
MDHGDLADEKYLQYWQQAAAAEQQRRQAAAQQAWREVQQIAHRLRQDFGATQIIVFGSLVRDRFTATSDIDIAVAGIAPDRYFEAVAAVNDLSDRWVDLKPLEDLESHFKQRVLETGRIWDAADTPAPQPRGQGQESWP